MPTQRGHPRPLRLSAAGAGGNEWETRLLDTVLAGPCLALGAKWERRFAGIRGQRRSDTAIVPRMNVFDVLERRRPADLPA